MVTKNLICDTCGSEASSLRRDVVDKLYNALSKPPLWNCETCYHRKRELRRGKADENAGDQ